jgi:acyl-CoA thioester hydrolase
MVDAAVRGISAAGTHVFPVRVYYEDTDAAGIVYHANYLRFAERARSEMMRSYGIESSQLMARERFNFAVARCVVDYLKPARLDDALEVHTRIVEIGRASLKAEQIVRCRQALLTRILIRLAVIDLDGRPVRLPAALRTTLINLSQSRE